MKVFTPNICGIITIIMWSMSALLISYTGQVPAFLLASMVFGMCSLMYFAKWIIKKERFFSYFKMSIKAYLTVLLGVGGYISFYYMAFKLAPPLEVNLLNYMWPILLVITSSLFSKNKFMVHQLAGIILGFLGVIIIFMKDSSFNLSKEYVLGYIFATMGAVIWSIYSVVTRKITFTPNNMSVFNLIFCFLFLLLHIIFEKTVMPVGKEWIGVVVLGVTTTSYMLWDYTMKGGDVELMASLSYFIPLFSTLLLAVSYSSQLTGNIIWSAAAIISGCLLVNVHKIVRVFSKA